MRLYSRTGATSVTHEGHTYEPDENGAFDFPEALGQQQHSFHVGGQPLWEDEIERQRRLMNEELERRKDPATLLDAVNKLVAAASEASATTGQEDKPKAAPRRRTSKPPAKS